LSVFLFLLIFGLPSAVFSASPDVCSQYATKALSQLKQAQDHGIPDLNPPVWSSDSASHYLWCLSVSEQEVANGEAVRQLVLDTFVKDGPPKGSLLPKMVTAKPVQGEILLPPGVKETCERYARESISQQQFNLKFSCGQSGAQWDSDYSHHYLWCIHGENYKRAAAEAANKNSLLSTCTADGCPFIAPGMTLGLRNSRINANDTFIPTPAIFTTCTPDISLVQWKTPDMEPGSFGIAPHFKDYWQWTAIQFSATKSANQYPLPPGVVIGLSGDEFTVPTAFGIIPFHGPEFLPGGLFQKVYGGDRGRAPGNGLYWYESTGAGFSDWPSVNRLPRGTVVALRHSDHHRLQGAFASIGSVAAKKVVQDIVWQGKRLDPTDSKIEPPPGFVRKHGGDLGADSGHGYYWYEKTTGQ